MNGSVNKPQKATGQIVFLPWVTLPYAVNVGGFRFVPLDLKEVSALIGDRIAATVIKAMRTHVDQSGNPIETCTILLRQRHKVCWDIPSSLLRDALLAVELLSISCLSEQKFFISYFGPHLNATMFHAMIMKLTEGSEQIGLNYQRRGGDLLVGGRKFSNTIFQQPPQIEGTRCEIVNVRLAKAIRSAQRSNHAVGDAICDSLEFFLLGQLEYPNLDTNKYVILSAIAFEKLLLNKPGAYRLAEAFAKLWSPFPHKKLDSTKRIKPDREQKWEAEQIEWPIHRKWMKELYELRSANVHRGPSKQFTSNWAAWQHLVIAAFVYPLAIKQLLAQADFYALDDDEQVCCETLDELLDIGFCKESDGQPQWPSILSMAQGVLALDNIISAAIAEVYGK